MVALIIGIICVVVGWNCLVGGARLIAQALTENSKK